MDKHGRHFRIPPTQGIKYAGSKLKLLPYIAEMMVDLPVVSILDGFSGSTRVSQTFAQWGFCTTSNDIAEWSETFATCFLCNEQHAKSYQDLISHLNALEGYDGWFTQHYGGDPNDKVAKKPFQRHNTQKLDAIRDEIEHLNLDKIGKAVALTSLILALDAVDSTMGHYASYLADWSPRSYQPLELKIPHLWVNTHPNRVFKGDIFDTITQSEYDLAYFDPPYGSNNEKMPPSRIRYASYYHIWTSVIKHDQPVLFGKVNRREDTRDGVSASVFEEFRRDETGQFLAMQAIRKLIQETQAHYILLSYSSGGRATKADLYEILNASGKVKKAIEIDYKKNVMSAMRWTNEWINSDGNYSEYLFLIEKN